MVTKVLYAIGAKGYVSWDVPGNCYNAVSQQCIGLFPRKPREENDRGGVSR